MEKVNCSLRLTAKRAAAEDFWFKNDLFLVQANYLTTRDNLYLFFSQIPVKPGLNGLKAATGFHKLLLPLNHSSYGLDNSSTTF